MLKVGRAEIYALDAFLAADRIKDVQIDVDLWSGYTDEIGSPAHAKHGETLLGYRLQPHEVEDMIGSSSQKIADGLNRLGFCGINDIGGTESSCRLQSPRLNVDHDYPRRAGDVRAADQIEPDASGPACVANSRSV